jgi:hypothetical protein
MMPQMPPLKHLLEKKNYIDYETNSKGTVMCGKLLEVLESSEYLNICPKVTEFSFYIFLLVR